MSTQETKIKNYYITDIYNTFKSNRKNKLSYFGVTTSENNKYLSYSSDSNVSKFFANISSPYPLSDNGKNSAYFKINNSTAYTIYSGHSYTYTEGVIVNDVKCALIAKSFINKMGNTNSNISSITLETGNIFHSAESPQTVNIYSDTSYYINNLGNKDTLTITKSEFNTLLGNNNFVDVESFIIYSYIEQKNPRDGIIHTDGKQRISNERYKDFHVWSFIDGFNSISHSYNGPTDNAKVNAYAYLAIGNDLKNYFESGLSRPINMIKLSYNLAQESLGNWIAGISENRIYVKETEQNYTDFYTRAKAHNLSTHTDESFANVCNHPSWRNNDAACDFYEYIKGTSNGDTNNTTQQNIDIENYNTAKFIKKINGLPVNIFNDNLKIYIDFDTTTSFRPPEGAGAGGQGSNYGGDVSVGQTLSNDAAAFQIRALKRNDNGENNWFSLGTIEIGASIKVSEILESAYGAQSFLVQIANPCVNYDNAKWADPNSNITIGNNYNIDELFNKMWLDADGEFDLSFSATGNTTGWSFNNGGEDTMITEVDPTTGLSIISVSVTLNWDAAHA